MAAMRVLITGHRGFIGQHLLAELESVGHEVAGVDITSTRSWDGIESHVGLDLADPEAAVVVVEGYRPDAVVHLAAQVGRLFGERDLAHTVTANVTMTALLAKACGEAGIPLLYASSSEVYGDQGTRECHEDDPLALPHNAYGLTKRQGEEFCQLYAPHGLRIVRLSMPYGPGAPPGIGRRALDTFLWQAFHVKRLTVHAGAERSWCWVGDTVAGIRTVLEGPPGAYNVGRDDCPVSMLDLARKCCDLAGASHELIDVVPAPERQTVVKRLSTTKLQLLGWEPTVELDEGLPEVLRWVRRFDADGQIIEGVL